MGLPMPPRHDDDLGVEHLGHLGVGEIEDRADAGVAGAFAQDEVLFPRHAVEGFFDLAHQRLAVGGLEILAGEVRLDRDGTHVHQRTVEPVDGVHQDGVFINLLFLNFINVVYQRCKDCGVTAVLFADDICILPNADGPKAFDQLQKALDSL